MQDLQWVLSGYLLTYGGFLLLGGRAADLLGRRWVFFVNPPVCALVLLAAFWLVSDDRRRARPGRFDIGGAVPPASTRRSWPPASSWPPQP